MAGWSALSTRIRRGAQCMGFVTVESLTIFASKLMSLKYDVSQVCVERTQEYDFNAEIGADT